MIFPTTWQISSLTPKWCTIVTPPTKNHNNRPALLACLRWLVSRSTFFSAFGFEFWSKSFWWYQQHIIPWIYVKSCWQKNAFNLVTTCEPIQNRQCQVSQFAVSTGNGNQTWENLHTLKHPLSCYRIHGIRLVRELWLSGSAESENFASLQNVQSRWQSVYYSAGTARTYRTEETVSLLAALKVLIS